MAPQGYNPQSNWGVPGGYQQQWGAGQGGDQVPPQQPQVNVNPGSGQPDYSLQWAEYYRTLGKYTVLDHYIAVLSSAAGA